MTLINNTEKQLRSRRLAKRLAGVASFLGVITCLASIYVTRWLPHWVPDSIQEVIVFLLAWDRLFRDFAASTPWIVLAFGVAWVVTIASIFVLQRFFKLDAGRYHWKIFLTGTLIMCCFLSGLSTLTGMQMISLIITHDAPVETEYPGWSTNPNRIYLAVKKEHEIDFDLVSNRALIDGGPIHSWTTALLPYLGHHPLYDSIDLSQNWNSTENSDEFQTVLEEFQSWSIQYRYRTREEVIRDSGGYALMHYAANSHVFGYGKPLKLEDINRGLSTTILLGEVIENLEPWGKPGHSRDPALGVGHPMGFGSANADSCAVLMGDGSMRDLPKLIAPELLKSLADPSIVEDFTEKEF